MFIPDPDFYPSRIPDLGSRIQKQQQKRRAKKHKFHQIANYFIFLMQKIFLPFFKKL
jgi:hypothetical protein